MEEDRNQFGDPGWEMSGLKEAAQRECNNEWGQGPVFLEFIGRRGKPVYYCLPLMQDT